jgi:DNA mismatch endonuclease (patch repair protein)
VIPASNAAFWNEKIGRNQARDKQAEIALKGSGWRVLKVWECALKGPGKRNLTAVIEQVATWLATDEPDAEITGVQQGSEGQSSV